MHFRRGLLGLGVVAVLAVAALFFQDDEDRAPAGGSSLVKVDRVVDGDTAKVFYGGRSEYVRYIGIDTPESVKPDSPVECYGEQAKAFNARLLARNPKVKLVFDRERRDHYGRLLAYVYSGGTLLNAELLRRGYATTLVVEPNDSKANQFAKLEDEARSAGRGLWSAC
ncbi:MAG: thermonuclease family protein [Solirubrobacterales bacterium]|nr:thermonuclease family protein [Solirubrobacterales bacterium]